jgi:putative spermidine/putrescine transport system ATP-binding protein
VGKAYLSLQDVAKNYGAVQAVEHVSLDVDKGEFVTFLGPSGSGKTTTLTMVAGFEEPTRGRIFLNGKDLTLLKPWQRNIGMVFQNYALFPHMTVEQNVAFPLRMRHMPKAEAAKRVAEVLDLVSLRGFASRQPRELSGGQQQRVAVARGLVFRPDVLLLDEPLGALDKNLREQMQIELKRIHREVGTTMIYVTHDQTEAMTMSDRIAVFNHGQLEQVGAPLEVYNRPQTRFVGEFVGDSNFFSGSLGSEPDVVRLDAMGEIRLPPGALDGIGDGRELCVMVRPERLRILQGAALPGSAVIDVEVGEIVNYGDSVLVVGRSGGRAVRMRAPGDVAAGLSHGATVKAAISPVDVHVIRSVGPGGRPAALGGAR